MRTFKTRRTGFRLACLLLGLSLLFPYFAMAAEGSGAKGALSEVKPKKGPPPIMLADAKKITELLKAAENKVVVLNIWATYCPPCVAEMPELAAFYNKHEGKDVVFISLSADEPEDIESKIRPFQAKLNLPFPIYVLNESDPKKFMKAVKTELTGVIPATLFYDTRGNAKRVWIGALTEEKLEELLKPLLKNPKKAIQESGGGVSKTS